MSDPFAHLPQRAREKLKARAQPALTFVTPKLVGEFGFTEWTRDGKLRHPRFLGLREDKKPRQVHRERPEA